MSNNSTEQQHPPPPVTTDGGRGGLAFGIATTEEDYDNNDDDMMTSLPTLAEERKLLGEEDDIDEDADEGRLSSSNNNTTTKNNVRDAEDNDESGGMHNNMVNTRISDRESTYHARRHNRVIREDGMSYREAMEVANIDKERSELIAEARKELIDESTGEFKTRLDDDTDELLATNVDHHHNDDETHNNHHHQNQSAPRRRRRRWDAKEEDDSGGGGGNNDNIIVTDGEHSVSTTNTKSRWDDDSTTTTNNDSNSMSARRRKRWDETPVVASGAAGTAATATAASDATPIVNSGGGGGVGQHQQKWDETPVVASGQMVVAATPMMVMMVGSQQQQSSADGGRKRSRWDSTPAPSAMQPNATPLMGVGGGGQTPIGGQTPLSGNLAKALSNEKEMERRNRTWTDAALDAILPSEGYTILAPPTSYMPIRTPGRKLLTAPTPLGGQTPAGFQMDIPPEEREGQSLQDIREAYGVPVAATANDGGESAAPGALPYIKPEDMQYFGRLMEDVDDESTLSKEEAKERQIMALLLKIKSGTPPQRKTAMRQITDKARGFGAGPLFHQILPLLMSPALEDQERHLLVKVIDRILYKLDDLVRPYVHRILAVIEPLLIDEDYYARVEGREIISNLAKAAGLSTMISTMRPDIDNPDEYVRNTTSRAFAVLKIKSGTPPQRKTAMRQITDKARGFGAGPLFHQILPLLMSPALEDQERHLLVKVIDRILYKLDDLVRPYVHRILAVIEPLLIDEDYYARVEGREIISNLAKAAGLSTMISTMRPDIDNPDEYVRNTTSRAFAVVASALGVPSLLPFLKAVCRSRKSWQARHTGIKIVQQIAVLMGCAVLPYLRELVEIVSNGLTDEQAKVRTMAALTVAALAEAAHPYGIESFDSVIRALWKGALDHHGKGLAAFLKAIGFIIPLMEENYASHYTRLVMPILTREFHSPDEEMKRIVLKVVKQCVGTAGVEPEYIRKEILPEFFRNFWIRRMALDRRNYSQVIETTEELANKVGCSDILSRIVEDLKDDSEPYRRMVMETIQKVLENLGSGDIDERLEERLIDGILYAFQEQAVDAGADSAFKREGQIMLEGFGTVVNALGERCKPYLKQIAGTIKWRLNNKAASVRMQAADLIGRIAVVMKACGEEQLMGHLGVVLYEYLGEEYPDVLGSILGALRAIVNVIGMTKMTPPIRDLLPRLTPILRNRHEKVQENCIDLVSHRLISVCCHFSLRQTSNTICCLHFSTLHMVY